MNLFPSSSFISHISSFPQRVPIIALPIYDNFSTHHEIPYSFSGGATMYPQPRACPRPDRGWSKHRPSRACRGMRSGTLGTDYDFFISPLTDQREGPGGGPRRALASSLHPGLRVLRRSATIFSAAERRHIRSPVRKRGVCGIFLRARAPEGRQKKVPEARSTRSPGWNEVEPWVQITILNSIALKGRCVPPGFYNALAGLGNLKRNANPGFRSQARFTLGCEYSVAPRLF